MTFIFIPVTFLLLIVLSSLGEPRGLGWSLIRAAIAAGALLVAITELLNATAGVNEWTVSFVWPLCVVALALVVWRKKKELRSSLGNCLAEIRGWFRGPEPGDRFFACFLAVWFALLLVIAIVAAPNNQDSLTYRLPRVMAWANNGSIDFFQTQIIRQNTRPPFSEWMFLHFFLTTKSDRLFNCLQWCAFALSAFAAVELARILGGDRRVRRFAVLLVATTPLAILQSTSTQNDLLSSFLAMAYVLFGWSFAAADSPEARWTYALYCGLAAGLCILSKPTLLPLLGIGGFAFAIRSVWGARTGALGPGIACLVVALLLAGGHLRRTHALTATFLGTEGETHHRSEPPWIPDDLRDGSTDREMSPRYLASNVSRNLALLLGSPMHGFNDLVVFCVWRLHDSLGIGVSEPPITFQNEKFSLDAVRHEDVSGNLPQVLLFLLSLFFLPRRAAARLPRAVYAFGIILTFVALSAVLTWQPWNTRIFLPLVLLACPLIAASLPVAAMPRMFPALCGALVLYAFPFVTENDTRPLLGEKSIFCIPRFVQFTRGNYESYSPYHHAVNNIRRRKYKSVGLMTEMDDVNYPFWPVLNARRPGFTKLYQIDPNNMTRKLPPPPKPEAVLATFDTPSGWLDTSYGRYKEVWREGKFVLFEQPDLAECH